MARKAAIEKQKRREKMVKLAWVKRKALKDIIYNLRTTEEDRAKAVQKLNEFPKNSSAIRLRNRCLITGRARGYLRKFKLSRLSFREYASQGYIPGITKSSW